MARTRSPEYDIVVVGGGPAGLAIGKYGPRVGARVAVVEADRLGGDCTWHGCVPSKALLASAHVAALVRRVERFGLPPAKTEAPPDLARVLERVRALQQRIYEDRDSPERLHEAGCEVIEGRGRFVSATELEVDGRTITSRYFCIATGSHPAVPPIAGLDQVPFLTNRDIFTLSALPPRLLVVGGGPIGLELGQALARLGSSVTVVEMTAHLLPREDPELADLLQARLEEEGISVRMNTTVKAVTQTDGGTRADLATSDGVSSVECDAVLIATGQEPTVEGLGLEAAGVAYDPKRGIAVDKTLRTSNRHIYACGDVIGRYPFTHMAGYEAGIVMRNALFTWRQKADYSVVPWATFTDPEVARVGLTEAEARERYGGKLRVSRHEFASVDRALLEERGVGLVKLLSAGRRNRIVGAHIIGPSAGELIHEFVLAMVKGISALDLAQMVHVYPTLSEGPRYAALQSLEQWLGSGLVRAAFRGQRSFERMQRLVRGGWLAKA